MDNKRTVQRVHIKQHTQNRSARLTKRSTWTEVRDCLAHAAWHCRYGTNADNTEREPTHDDLEAWVILEILKEHYQ